MPHIAIEGCIGAGKSTLARALAKRLDAELLEEATHLHPFLTKFYSDPRKYGLETELNFLLIHYHQLAHQNASCLITDFTLGKDLVFARMNLSGQDLDCFEALFSSLISRLKPPDEVILLDIPPSVCLARISARAKEAEYQISSEYLAKLRSAYIEGLSLLGKIVRKVEIAADDSPERVLDLAISALFPTTETVA
jgi:deoxyguanosine kinase